MAKPKTRRTPAPKVSPLHTPKALATLKLELVSKLGRDADGAWRWAKRKDGR